MMINLRSTDCRGLSRSKIFHLTVRGSLSACENNRKIFLNVFKDLAPRRPGSPWGIDRIVGGHAADPYTWQWIVHFKIGCGGSIIHPNFVVTAGHCCFSTNPQDRM